MGHGPDELLCESTAHCGSTDGSRGLDLHKHQLLIFGLIQQTHLLLLSNNNDNVRTRPTINKTKLHIAFGSKASGKCGGERNERPAIYLDQEAL